MGVVLLKAKLDKETKRMHRYLIQKNDEGISGTIYIKKDEDGKKPQKTIKIKEV